MKTKFMMQTIVGMCCLAMAFGCATSGGGTAKTKAAAGGDEKTAITKMLGEWSSALASKDVNKIMPFYSDSFKNDEGMDKAGMQELIAGAISQGYLDGAKVDVASAQVSVNGEEAVVAPVNLSGDMGALSLSFSLKKEAGTWRIASSRQA